MNKVLSPPLLKKARTLSARWPQFVLTGAASALLVACQSTPLPPWQDAQGSNAGKAPVSTASGAQQGVVTQATDASYPVQGYSAAVAARYPDPATRYQTPGLQAAKGGVSSNQDVHLFLSHLTQGQVPGVHSRVDAIGRSQDGQDIYAIFLSQGGAADAAGFAASGKPTVLLVGGQRGSDRATTEALLADAQLLTQGEWSRWLQSVNVIIVPLANPDAAGKPDAATADGVDLTTDHLLLRTPEARALAQLQTAYRPSVVVDHQEFRVGGPFAQKFNAFPAFDAYVQAGSAPNTAEFVNKAVNEWFVAPVFDALKAQDLRVDWETETSSDLQDKTVSMAGLTPNSLLNVSGLKNSVSLLVNSRGADLGSTHIQRRVHTHVVADGKIIEQAAARAAHLGQVRNFVNRDAASQACRGQIAITAEQTLENRAITAVNPASGADMRFDATWRSSMHPRVTASRTRACGYLIEGNEAQAVARLQALGLSVLRVAEPGELQVQTYAGAGNNGVQLSDLRVQVPEGSYYIPMSQPLAQLAAAALEPDSAGSFFSSRVIGSLNHIIRAVEPPALVFEEVE